MTLVVTLATNVTIFQASDFRLSSGSSTEDTSFKSLQAGGPKSAGWTWSGLFSYAGVGQVGTTDTSQWLFELLNAKAHTMSLDDAIALIRNSWHTFVAPARRHLNHTFIIGAFDRGVARVLMLSNSSRLDPTAPSGATLLATPTTTLMLSEETPRAGKIYIVGSGAQFIQPEAAELARLSRRLPRDRHGLNRTFETLAQIMKTAARRAESAGNPTVSSGCWCATISAEGGSSARLFGVPGAQYAPPTLQYPLPDSKAFSDIVTELQRKLAGEAIGRELLNEQKRAATDNEGNTERERHLIQQSRSLDAATTRASRNRAFIPNRGSDNVSIIDTVSHEIVGLLAIGANPTAIAVDPLRDRVYVTQDVKQPHEGSGSVAIIDALKARVVGRVEVGIAPSSLALTSDGGLLYVANLFSNDIAVMDTEQEQVIAWISIGCSPVSIVVSPRSRALYVTDGQGHQVLEVDLVSHVIVRAITVGQNPTTLAMTHDGSRLFVTNQTSNDLSVVDTVAGAVIGTVQLRRSPRGLVLNSAGDRAYVTCIDSNVVSIVDTIKMRLLLDVPVGREPQGVDIDSGWGLRLCGQLAKRYCVGT